MAPAAVTGEGTRVRPGCRRHHCRIEPGVLAEGHSPARAPPKRQEREDGQVTQHERYVARQALAEDKPGDEERPDREHAQKSR